MVALRPCIKVLEQGFDSNFIYLRDLIFAKPIKGTSIPVQIDHLLAVDHLREEPTGPTPVLSEMDSVTQKECLLGLFGAMEWQADYDYKVERSRS